MDERNEQDDAQVDQEPLKDLDVDQDDADKVTGGRRGDPTTTDDGQRDLRTVRRPRIDLGVRGGVGRSARRPDRQGRQRERREHERGERGATERSGG